LGTGAAQKHYVLFAGDWYCVEKQFKKQIDDFFDATEKVTIIGATTCRNEELLIADVQPAPGNRTREPPL
jgi:uncharacterized protein (TIGR04141 family)